MNRKKKKKKEKTHTERNFSIKPFSNANQARKGSKKAELG